MMPRYSLPGLLVLVGTCFSGPSLLGAETNPRDLAQRQVEFGIEVARKGLWKEAVFRWQKALEVDPDNARARNNLGVAYEQEGQFELAEAEYKRALELDSENMYIRQNYELFREGYERRKRKVRSANLP